MNTYKVLLVDDEEDVRNSIVRKLNWAELGFQVAGEADNGVEALELAERLEPDIVMTDIKMPFMDGLELCRRVKKILPGVRLAIFSGFDEFEYAREAITRQVTEYILKPIDAEELEKVFRRLRASLDEEIAQRRDRERLQLHYEKSLPLLRQQLLSELLEGHLDSGDIAGRMSEYGLPVSAAGYCVAVVQYDLSGAERTGGEQLADVSLHRLIEEHLDTRAQYFLVRRLGRMALIFQPDRGIESIMEQITPLFSVSRRLLDITLAIGVGRIYARTDGIALSYREACSALEYRLLMEPGHCIYIGDIEPGTPAAPEARQPDFRYAEELVRCIKVGSGRELRAAVDGVVSNIKEVHLGIQQSHIYLLELFTELLRLIRTYRMDPAESHQDRLLQGLSLQFANLDFFGEWLAEFCENLRMLARRERKDSVRQLIDRSTALLRERYADCELSLESVCSELNVSAAYLSTVFKRETGKGFVACLTDLRMEKALELLSTTDLKAYRIAEAVGYGDPNYFSYVFKRRFGVAPSKFRADRVSNDAADFTTHPKADS